MEQRRCTLLRACSGHQISTLDVIWALLTHRPPDVQHSMTMPFRWLQQVRGTACRRLSGMHRRWRRSVASWRLYFSGRPSTMIRRSWLYCTVTVVCPRLLTVGDSVVFVCFSFLFNFVRCRCNVTDVIVSRKNIVSTLLLTYYNIIVFNQSHSHNLWLWL